MGIKEKLAGAVGPMLFGIGRDFLAAVAPEVMPLFNEWWEQRQTPDGWTDLERLTYLYSTVSRIKQKEIGPAYVDSVIDWALQSVLKNISSDIDRLEGQAPSLPPADEDDETPGQFRVMYKTKPSMAGYYISATLWANQPPVPDAKRWVVLPAGEAGWVGWVEEMWE